ncbi:MAG: HEAT repeat domain-containing protein [Anaeromyxobacter sp.]|nr:HEAT repeat domain-containing protein [Anaeromyxobacter sp.]MBL0276109.1 HEAT repeat domain-containing protein [Anaeromyxobacter sp.]
MGIFDLFGSKDERQQGAIKKLARKVTEKYGPPENRQKVVDQLGELGTAAALQTLCLRFTVHAEPGITDQEEKEAALRWLVDARRDAIAPVSAFVQEQESGIAWGLRALAEVARPEEVLAVVTAELARLGTVYTRDPEKKLTLLAWAAQHHAGAGAEDVERALLPLLEDFSDDVRIGAAKALADRPPSEPAREGLLQLLLRSGDNARVRGEVLAALHQLGADVKGHRPSVEPLLVEPWYLDKDGVVKKRG